MDGLNLTGVIINNEAYDSINLNKDEFINIILTSLNSSSNNIQSYTIGNHQDAIKIINMGNRDIPKLYLTHTSNMIELGYNNQITNLEYRKGLLDLAKRIICEEERIIKKLEFKKNKQL